jgi:hypothetical protein
VSESKSEGERERESRRKKQQTTNVKESFFAKIPFTHSTRVRKLFCHFFQPSQSLSHAHQKMKEEISLSLSFFLTLILPSFLPACLPLLRMLLCDEKEKKTSLHTTMKKI